MLYHSIYIILITIKLFTNTLNKKKLNLFTNYLLRCYTSPFIIFIYQQLPPYVHLHVHCTCFLLVCYKINELIINVLILFTSNQYELPL